MARTAATPRTCRECGRHCQTDSACWRHGGSAGLILDFEGLARPLRALLILLATVAFVDLVVGVLTMFVGDSITGNGHHQLVVGLGVYDAIAAIVLLCIAMYLSQLRSWSRTVAAVWLGVQALVDVATAADSDFGSGYRVTIAVRFVVFVVAIYLLYAPAATRAALQRPSPASAPA